MLRIEPASWIHTPRTGASNACGIFREYAWSARNLHAAI